MYGYRATRSDECFLSRFWSLPSTIFEYCMRLKYQVRVCCSIVFHDMFMEYH